MRPLVFLCTIMILSSVAKATDGSSCSLSTFNDVVNCAVQKHPDVQSKELDVRRAQYELQRAGQLANPEFDGSSSSGKADGISTTKVEASLMFDFELLTRGSRKGAARARQELAEIENASTKELTKIKTIALLYRLRQLKQELGAITEALETFSKIQRLYQGRPKLAPEQQVSLDVFTLASGDYRLKKTRTQKEYDDTLADLELAVGQRVEVTEKILPPVAKQWPKFEEKTRDTSASTISKALRKETEAAEQEYNLASNEAWPNIKIGPTYELEMKGADRVQFIGIGLSMPIPIFNWNGGAKGAALEQYRIAEIKRSSSMQFLDNEKKRLANTYKQYADDFTELQKRSDILQKHRNLHGFLERGIVPAPLVIESHRQMTDFTISMNEQELLAVQALWRLYVLEGRALEERAQ